MGHAGCQKGEQERGKKRFTAFWKLGKGVRRREQPGKDESRLGETWKRKESRCREVERAREKAERRAPELQSLRPLVWSGKMGEGLGDLGV